MNNSPLSMQKKSLLITVSQSYKIIIICKLLMP
jgi:hypothetical protein